MPRRSRNTPVKTRSVNELLETTTPEHPVGKTLEKEMAEDENDRLGVNDFLGKQPRGYQSGIKVPQFQATNFEIKQTMLKMLELIGQFGGYSNQDPNRHLVEFLDVCDSFKQNGVPSDVIRLRLFPYSLQGKAKEWLNNLEEGSISSWDDLEEKFRSRFFPHNKIVDARAKLMNFSQQFDEHLYEAWERFKLLVRQSPGHNQEKWVLLQIFSSRLTPESKSELNAVTNGGITKQPVNHVWSCLDDLAADYIQNSNERKQVKSVENAANDSSSQVIAMLNTLNKRFDHLEARVDKSNRGQLGVNAIYTPCDYCGDGHASEQCPTCQQVEPVNYAGNFWGNNQNNPYANTYNPGLRNHPNLSWKHGSTLDQVSTSG
ncbi:uncharacterized protein LOC114747879 [Neltuma alba]|uniref:uncharacterized protein LOC114747879 n=1 Tax=Neltuma alba TaxID=207710 RepID=UPI0010A581EE|nr:uncharacterized protein LOC114747879 [Prosopis alba]